MTFCGIQAILWKHSFSLMATALWNDVPTHRDLDVSHLNKFPEMIKSLDVLSDLRVEGEPIVSGFFCDTTVFWLLVGVLDIGCFFF